MRIAFDEEQPMVEQPLPDIANKRSDSLGREIGRIEEKYKIREDVKAAIESGALSSEEIESKMGEHESAIAKMPNVLDLLRYINQHVKALVKFDKDNSPIVHDKITLEDAIWDYIIEVNIIKDLVEGDEELALKKIQDRTEKLTEAIKKDASSQEVAVAKITRAAGLRGTLVKKIHDTRGGLIHGLMEGKNLPSHPNQCRDWVELVWIINTNVEADKIYTIGVKQDDGSIKLRQFQNSDLLDYVKYVALGQMPIDFLPSKDEVAGKTKGEDVNFLVSIRGKMEEFLGR